MKWFFIGLYGAFLLCLVIPAFSSADEFTDKQLEQSLLMCEHRQKMAEAVQFVRIRERNEFDDFSRVIEVTSNQGGPLGDFVSPEQISIKDSYFAEILNIAFEVYSFFDIGIAPDHVGLAFQEVCRMEFEANKPNHMEGRLDA